MKGNPIIRAVERMLRMPEHGDEPRADLYLPDWLLLFGAALLAGGVGCGVLFAVSGNMALLAGAVGLLLTGLAAVLCWRNQTIRMINSEVFVYTTFLGNRRCYAFSQIHSIRRNADSTTLFVGEGKVHIESCARMTGRLIERLNSALAEKEVR